MAISVDHKQIESSFTKYFSHLAKREHHKAIDYIYPRLFTILPKKALLATMTESDKSMNITFGDLSIEKFSRLQVENKIQYLVLTYRYQLVITFPAPETDNEEPDEESPMSFTFEILKGKHGKKNVTIDRKKLQLKANVESQVYCISDPAHKGWKFMEKRKGAEELLEKLLKES